MEKVFFGMTAAAALATAGIASAQGITLFGEARLGLGYNINTDGGLQLEADPNSKSLTRPTDDVNAISRVRFGVNMTGETNSGITFGASIRADNAGGGEGGSAIDDGRLTGMTEGDVFVSGSFGTLTYGDTNGADEQWVGDLLGDYSLTGLGDNDETIFFSDGNGFSNANGTDFQEDPLARPTIRYDYSFGGFGLSLSSNRALTDVGIGGGYAGTFAGGTFRLGLGYYDYQAFETTASIVENGVLLPGISVPSGHEVSAMVGGTFGDFGGNVIWTTNDSADASFDTLGLGLTAGFGNWDFGGWYRQFVNASGTVSGVDGSDAYGLSGQYDLGGGAFVMGGVARTYDLSDQRIGSEPDATFGAAAATVADFGIMMNF